jgi:hypothetical protein
MMKFSGLASQEIFNSQKRNHIGVLIGYILISTVMDPSLLLAGQQMPTILKKKLNFSQRQIDNFYTLQFLLSFIFAIPVPMILSRLHHRTVHIFIAILLLTNFTTFSLFLIFLKPWICYISSILSSVAENFWSLYSIVRVRDGFKPKMKNFSTGFLTLFVVLFRRFLYSYEIGNNICNMIGFGVDDLGEPKIGIIALLTVVSGGIGVLGVHMINKGEIQYPDISEESSVSSLKKPILQKTYSKKNPL